MTEETSKNESAQQDEAEQQEGAAAPSAKKKKKWPITLSVIVVVVIAAGAGFWVWHEQPSFCGAICHTPMDPYLANYDAEPGQVSFDKYGNEVTDANAMMAIAHKDAGVVCMDCHVPTIEEQVSEATHWISGDYEFPLDERSLEHLTAARGATADEFCLNENCHNMTRDELAASTADMTRNPHDSSQPGKQHEEQDCGTCHKGHRASVNYCSQCHDDSPIPSGWLTWGEQKKLGL